MRHQATTTMLTVAALAFACGPGRPQAVPLVADPGTLATLAGEWSGDYSSPETGRTGSITFALAPGRDTVYGDVVMREAVLNEPVASDSRLIPLSQARARHAPVSLSIGFVRLTATLVSGRLEPYRDPACGCPVETTFTGRLTGHDVIEGTYTTRGTGSHSWHVPTVGRWRVTRVR